MDKKKIALVVAIIIIGISIAAMWYLHGLIAWKFYGYVVDYDGTPIEGAVITLEAIEEEGQEAEEGEPSKKRTEVTDENGYYEFKSTYLYTELPVSKLGYKMEVTKEIEGGEYTAHEEDIFIYGENQEKNITFLDQDVKKLYEAISGIIVDKFGSLTEESAPAASTGATSSRYDISGLGEYYIEVEEVFNGTNYSIIITLGANDETVKEIDPIYLNNSRVYIITDEPWRFEHDLPLFKGKVFKNCIDLPSECALNVASGKWRIPSECGKVYIFGLALDDWCLEDGCGDLAILTHKFFKDLDEERESYHRFNVQEIKGTDDPNMDDVIFEVIWVYDWMKMK